MARPVVLITGGSRGIGASIARLAGARGYDVVVNYRFAREQAEQVVADCVSSGARAVAVPGNTNAAEDVAALFATAAAFGPLRHVVNNAGITGRSSPLAEAEPDTIRECIDINVTGAILVAREAARNLRGQGGSIVNISSVAATLGSPGEFVWYAASKGAIDALTTGLAKELAGAGIRVNAVSPGLIETEIHALSTGDAARVERLRPMIPMGRIGQPDEIAEAVLFLMSDAASYMTGANLKVSGGR